MSGVTPQQVQEAIGVLLSVFTYDANQINSLRIDVGQQLHATTSTGKELVAKIVATG